MATWNYRLVRLKSKWVGLYEVYYNERGEPCKRTMNAITLGGGTKKEARRDLLHAMEAAIKPVLDDKDIHGH